MKFDEEGNLLEFYNHDIINYLGWEKVDEQTWITPDDDLVPDYATDFMNHDSVCIDFLLKPLINEGVYGFHLSVDVDGAYLNCTPIFYRDTNLDKTVLSVSGHSIAYVICVVFLTLKNKEKTLYSS